MDLNSIDISQEEALFQKADETSVWIYKPAAMNCGKGITLITDLHKFKEEYFKHKKQPKTQAQIPNNKGVSRVNPRRKSTKHTLPMISSKYAIQTQESKKKSKSKDVVSRRIPEEKIEEVKEKEKTKSYTLLKKGVIQKYLENPLLLDGRKFDYRYFYYEN